MSSEIFSKTISRDLNCLACKNVLEGATLQYIYMYILFISDNLPREMIIIGFIPQI